MSKFEKDEVNEYDIKERHLELFGDKIKEILNIVHENNKRSEAYKKEQEKLGKKE